MSNESSVYEPENYKSLEIQDLAKELFKLYNSLPIEFKKLFELLSDTKLSGLVHYLSELESSYGVEFCSKFYDENQERIRERLILE
mgnify:CR=1 FL=1|jgi:hypothetical protein